MGQRIRVGEARIDLGALPRPMATLGAARDLRVDLDRGDLALAAHTCTARHLAHGYCPHRYCPHAAGAYRSRRSAHPGTRRRQLLVGAGMSRTARVFRVPVLVVVVASVVAALVLDRSPSASTVAGAQSATSGDGASVPPAAAVSISWFCAEGTSAEGGRADETVVIASLATQRIDATVTVMPAGNQTPVSHHVKLAPRSQQRVQISSVLRTAEPGVVVEVVGGQAVVTQELRGNDDVAIEPCTRRPGTDWYFAAGTSVKGSQQFLVLFNPFGDDAIVDTTLYT